MTDPGKTAEKRPSRLANAVEVLTNLRKGANEIYGLVAIVLSLAALVGFKLVFDPPSPTPTPIPEVRSIPNVYDMASNQAVTVLKGAGFAPRTILVCSHSVAQGQVRQVLLDGGQGDGVVLVDMDGVTPGLTFANGTAVVVKVSTGIPC